MGNFDRTSWFYTIFKMEVTTWLSLLLAVIALGSTASASEPRVVCYYTNWSVYRPGTARFNPQNINPYLCTHLVYAFGGFTKDNTFKPFDKYQDIEKGGYAKFTGLKTYNKNLKTMLAIGGWNEGSSRFSPMVGSRERRKEFVRNAIKFLRQNRFDGLDLDWEYPAFRDGGKPKDRENYAKLVKELREEFERESEKTGKPRLLLTMAVPAGIEYIQKGFDVKTLNRYLDWMNLLSYDYHSAFEPAVNHHAPLYPLEEPNEYSVDNELNIDYTIKFYIESGADPSKLVLGIPTYGRSYTLFNPDAVEIGSPADGPGEQGDATREKGYLAYYEICESLKPKKKKRQAYDEDDSEEYSDEEEEEDEEWTVMHPNSDAMGPVAFKGNQWVGYDDVDIVRKKAEYVAENGLGGIMFWSIDNDDFRGTCHNKPYPLIEAAKESYFAKLGSTGNVIREKVQTSTRRKSRPRSSTTTTTTTPKPVSKANRRKSTTSVTSTTPVWNIITPEPPTTPDPGSDFKCVDEGFYPHPRDCKKYFWCLDSGPSNLGIVANQFTCPSGLFFNKAADSCDFARNVPCKIKDPVTKAPTTRAPTTKAITTTTTTTRKPIRLSTKSSSLFRTTSSTTPEPEEYEDESGEEPTDEDAEDPRVLKELIDLIKKVGGIEQLEKHLHFGENSQASTDGAVTTTPSPYKKKLYQKVLERTRGQNRYTGPNSILETAGQNSRRGPQNAGIEPSNDGDKSIRKDRPQYTTINRQRGSKGTTEATPESEEIEDEESEEEVQQNLRAKSVDTEFRVGTTSKPLQYVNIRRARPTTSDTADDTASRNALFERSEPFVSVSDSPNSLDILSARRENQPEYVTIRRQRPTTEETTTVQYQNSEEEVELQETALEREISTQPQYTSIVRSRSTARPTEEPSSEAPVLRVRSTTVATEETSSPDPTTVLSVQISSLLNSPSAEIETTETESPAPTTVVETTTPTTTTTTTTTTPAPPSIPSRRTLIRRRGSTTPSPSTAAPSSTTQVSPRNYTIVNRRRPLPRPNEISSNSEESDDVSRKIRSTTPDSREVDEAIPRETGPVGRRFRSRFQASKTARSDDSIPAAASPVSRGSFKPQVLNPDEVISLTPIDVEPQFVPRQSSSFSTRADRRFRRPLPSTASDANIPDSEGSAATVETSRPNLLPRGRNRFTISTTTEATAQPASVSLAQRRPTFARFTPRPFTRSPSSTASPDADDENTEEPEGTTTQRIAPRLPFGRSRPTSTPSPRIIARKLPFPSRQSTTQQALSNDDDDDEPEAKSDDILLSESAREEKEHEEGEVTEEAPIRRVRIKKLRTSGAADSDTIPTETIPIDDSGKKRFRVIRRRPTSSTAAPEPVVTTEAPTAPGPQRIRKVIRKKLKPAEDETELTAKSVGSQNTFRTSTIEEFNYGEKTRPTTTTTEIVTEPIIEEVTEFYKEKKVKVELQNENVETKEEVTEKLVEKEEEKQEEEAVEQTTIASANVESIADAQTKEHSNTENIKVTVTEAKSADTEASSDTNSNTAEENKKNSDKSESEAKIETESKPETDSKSEVTVISEGQTVEVSENQDTTGTEATVTQTDVSQTETTTASTTVSTTSTSKTRLPFRPRKKLYTPSTEPSVPSTSRVFSRKYNPGVYTSPATADRPLFRPTGSTRRPFSSKLFTRKPFTPKTTLKFEDDEEYNDEELLEEDPESDNPFVFVPPNQLFTRKPDSEEEHEEGEVANSEELLDEEEEGPNDEEAVDEDEPTKVALTTRRPGFRPRVVNSNTFRTSTSTTAIPKRFSNSQNRTGIITRFSNKPAIDGKKRVQNVPPGYNSPVNVPRPKGTAPIVIKNGTQEAGQESKDITTTTAASATEGETTTTFDDDYLSVTSTTLTDVKELTTSEDLSTTNTDEMETATYEMEVDNSTDDYLESTEGTTSYPTTQDITTISQTEAEIKTTIVQNTVAYTVPNTETTTEPVPTTVPTTTTTEPSPPPPPIIKTQFDKLFSITRVVEVNSKLDKHHINKNNETTHIEEGKIMVEKKPVIDKIGEVSRYSLIKIVEDEIPIYLTKFGHIYPVEHPPENHIRIDEARNARALVETFLDTPRENLVASESVNEAYRHVKKVSDSKTDDNKDDVEHLPSDDFLSYVNEENKTDQEHDGPLFASWQFVPAAYENEKVRAAKSFEIVTPRSMLTNPSTLSLEGLFKTENPLMARKVNDDKNQPFVVYSASVPTQEEEANIVKISPLKPESGRSILTFAKGQEFNGGSADEVATVKYPVINISVLPQTSESSTVSPSSTTSTTMSSTTPTTTTTTESPSSSSPIIDLLSTTQATTEVPTTISTDATSTTETVLEETTTVKISPLDAKRAKFGFPRRPVIKSSNFTRPSGAPRTVKKINATVASNLNQKANKTSFSPSKSRFSANRVQNVPVDIKKKNNSSKVVIKTFTTAKTYTTESPKTTTERKIYFKPIRPNFRPAFFPRKTTTPPVTGDTAAKRNFLRRTKATAPPDTTETESVTDKIETTTNKFTRRGNSKFKSRKEAELEKKGATAKNEVENASRRPSFNSGARRNERPTRKFVRVRPGGANATTSTIASPLSTSSPTLVTRRPFRVTSRRRLSSTTTTTTTTTEAPTTIAVPTTPAPQAVTNAYEDEESLQDIGDIDAIEDPTLEPKVPKKTYKVQRRPLVNLKDDAKDQNPSATNEEENKRQSKKYSSTIKQNQLNDLLKLRSQEETTTERKTTVDDFNAETALAIAAHKLITAPIPSITDFEEVVNPTRKTQTTVEYKYTSREYNTYSDISRTPTYDEYQSTPVYRGSGTYEQTTAYRNPTFDTTKTAINFDTTKEVTDFDTTKEVTDFDNTKEVTDFENTKEVTDFRTTKIATDLEAPKLPTTSTIYKTDYAQTSVEPFTSEFDAPKISTTTYDVPKSTAYPNTVNTANTANLEFLRTNSNDFSITSAYEPPKATPTFSPRSPSTIFQNTATNDEFGRTTFGNTYDTQTDFISKNAYLPRATATNFPTNTVPSEFTRTIANTYLDTSTEVVQKTSPTYVPKFPSTDFQNTINQEFVRTTLNSYDNTQTELNAPKISSTLAPPTPTRYFERTTFADTPTENSPRTAFVPTSTATTKFSRSGSRFTPSSTNAAPTGYTGVQRSTRYRTEKLIPVPVENTGYSTVSYSGPSQEPSYFTREYLLESPVTKTYDDEYQYLSPITTPQTPATPPTRKVIRKKIQRRISTTLRPTEAPSSTTPVPRRKPTKQPFEKIAKVPKKTYRPIANYDYYDDSDEKVAVKYVEGTKIVMHDNGQIECLDIGNFPHPKSCKKFISCARIDNGSLLGWEYVCPKGLSFDPVGGICNWSAGLGCDEKDN